MSAGNTKNEPIAPFTPLCGSENNNGVKGQEWILILTHNEGIGEEKVIFALFPCSPVETTEGPARSPLSPLLPPASFVPFCLRQS